ncbi:MAG: GNAT family N-acetyltransferase [Candidatus Cloacimonetes bacterium]|nr:GNAT family N-acetyltransferase [Candidatus Cloacimonadota bacterium]
MIENIIFKKIGFEDISEEFQKHAEKERISFLNKPEAHYFGAFDCEKLIGTICAVLNKNGKNGKLKSSYVLKEYRGNGIYTELNKMALGYAKEHNVKQLTLNCLPSSVSVHIKAGAVEWKKSKTIAYLKYDF